MMIKLNRFSWLSLSGSDANDGGAAWPSCNRCSHTSYWVRRVGMQTKRLTKCPACFNQRATADMHAIYLPEYLRNDMHARYDGDQVLGYRLYKEITKTESNQKNKEKGCLVQPTHESSWETLATNLKEFKKISDNLMYSKCSTEAAISEIVKTEVIHVLEKLQKKKSQTIKGRGLKRKTLKQKRTQTLLLDVYQNSSGTGTRHSQRLQKLVKYTYGLLE